MQPIKCFYVWQLSDKNAFFVGVYCLTNHQIDLDARYLVSPKNPQKTRKLEIRIKFTILKKIGRVVVTGEIAPQDFGKLKKAFKYCLSHLRFSDLPTAQICLLNF